MDTTNILKRETLRFFDRSADWILTTGPRILLAILLLCIGIWLIRILRRKLSKNMAERKVHSSLRPFFESLAFTALHVALFFLVMQVVGIQLTMFAAVIAAFGAAAGLALSGTLQNFASGVLILLLKPFKVGDNISSQGIEGRVLSIQIFYTVIAAYDKKTVIMPNSKLSNEVIINITKQGIRRADITLKFKLTTDYDLIKEKLSALFLRIDEVCNDPAPRIGITTIDKEEYTVICNVWVNAHGFEDSRLIIYEKIFDELRSNGVFTA